MKARLLLLALVPLLMSFAQPSLAAGADTQQAKQGADSMQQDLSAMRDFNNMHQDETGLLKVSTKERHEILFFMGIGLIIGLLMTAGFGLGMVLGGRPLFIWHMLFAGISIMLALAHAVTAMIWFYPF
jgi:hypothetical protein